MNPAVLVLGYGSDLRRDDAVGRHVAEAVGAHGLAGVEVRVLHQLTPELAADLDGRALVVFVDAASGASAVRASALDPTGTASPTSHHLDPRGLLALAARLGWSPVRAALVAVPAHDLGLGEELSPDAAALVPDAIEKVVALCRSVGTAVRC